MKRIAAMLVFVTAAFMVTMPAATAGSAVTIQAVAPVSVGPILPSDCGPYCMVQVDVTVVGKGALTVEVMPMVGGQAVNWASTTLRGAGNPRTASLDVGVPAGSAVSFLAVVSRGGWAHMTEVARAESGVSVPCAA